MVIDKRNIEDIRRKNLEDNQIFLEKLLMINVNYLFGIFFYIIFIFIKIRDDFLNSARLILRKNESNQIKKKLISQQEK